MAAVTVWVGVDIGKAHHHATALDGAGEVLLSRRVANTETDLLALVDEVAGLGGAACREVGAAWHRVARQAGQARVVLVERVVVRGEDQVGSRCGDALHGQTVCRVEQHRRACPAFPRP